MQKLQMKKSEYSGKLITFCGLDGCGKTTLLTMYAEYLKSLGIDVVITKQPTSVVRQSEIFRTYMDCPNHENFEYRSLSLLAASDRVQHTHKFIEPLLKEGKVVISDRYYYSCLANLRARGYEQDRWIYEIAETIIEPDMAVFADIDVETAVNRVRMRPEEKERYIDMDLQYKLRGEYIDIAKKNNGVLLHTGRTVNETFEQLVKFGSLKEIQMARVS